MDRSNPRVAVCFAATEFILGIQPDFDGLRVEPCIPADWKEFTVIRKWRGSTCRIRVSNSKGVEKGVVCMRADGTEADKLPVLPAGSTCSAEILMG